MISFYKEKKFIEKLIFINFESIELTAEKSFYALYCNKSVYYNNLEFTKNTTQKNENL